jgi:DNA mismatch endonuclease, patch repair protein
MAAIRSRNTGPEVALRRALRAAGLVGYRCHHPGLPGKPDIAYTRWGVAVFVDGAYWHGHPDHFTFGKLGDYWDEKVRRTQQRDRDQERALMTAGYDVIRIWDFEVKKDADACAMTVAEVLKTRGRETARLTKFRPNGRRCHLQGT